MTNKNKYLKLIGSTLIVGVFLLFAFGSGESDEKVKIDINDQQALEKYIQGKWSWEKHTGDINHTWRYRFEINGNKLKIWSCFNNTDDPFDMSGGYEEFNFTLGSPTRDVDGYKARYLEFAVFDKTNFFGLTYYGLSPFWLVSDDNWDTPVLKCGSGIPSWSREEFQATGNKITHGESNSNTRETSSESDYSSSNEATSESSNSTYDYNSESTNYQEEVQNSNYINAENERENELEVNNSSKTNYEEYNFNGLPFVKTPININPNPINGSQNVFFNKNYTLFDQTRITEPIFPVNKNGIIVYQIYYSSNEDPRPYYGEFTPTQLEKHLYYKFKNKENCMVFCNSKK